MPKFPSEMDNRGTVKLTDKIMIHNIDTGETQYSTISELFALLTAALALKAPLNNPGFTGVIGNAFSSGGGPVVLVEFRDSTNSASTTSGISWKNTGAGTLVEFAQLFAGYGAGYTNSKMIFKVADSSKVLQERIFIDVSGNIGNTGTLKSKIQIAGLVEYADNAAAVGAGLTVGAFYRTGDTLKVVH